MFGCFIFPFFPSCQMFDSFILTLLLGTKKLGLCQLVFILRVKKAVTGLQSFCYRPTVKDKNIQRSQLHDEDYYMEASWHHLVLIDPDAAPLIIVLESFSSPLQMLGSNHKHSLRWGAKRWEGGGGTSGEAALHLIVPLNHFQSRAPPWKVSASTKASVSFSNHLCSLWIERIHQTKAARLSPNHTFVSVHLSF